MPQTLLMMNWLNVAQQLMPLKGCTQQPKHKLHAGRKQGGRSGGRLVATLSTPIAFGKHDRATPNWEQATPHMVQQAQLDLPKFMGVPGDESLL